MRAESLGKGQGATFTVLLPARVEARSTRRPSRGRRRPLEHPAGGTIRLGLRVLVVDDEADARELLGTMLPGGGPVDVADSAPPGSTRTCASPTCS